MTALLSPVFTAEARALADLWPAEQPTPGNGEDREHWRTLLNAILPDALDTPNRLRRLWDAVWEWFCAQPRAISQAEQVRQELLEIYVAQEQHAARLLEAARSVGLAQPSIDKLAQLQEDVVKLRQGIFDHWRPFTREEHQQAVEEIRRGEVHDVEDVIRELQSRHHDEESIHVLRGAMSHRIG